MSSTLTNAREIYYASRNSETNERRIIPVRGVYVADEYKSPLYAEPILRVLEFNTNHCLIEDYTEAQESINNGSSHHLYDIIVDASFTIELYTQAKAPNQLQGSSHHLYDVSVDPTFIIESYQSEVIPQHNQGSSHHLYDIIVDSTCDISLKSENHEGSQPEPILRIIEFNTPNSTIEDV